MSDMLRHALYAPARWIWQRRNVETPVDPSTVRHVLVLRYDAIGDMVVTLPMFDAIHEACPTATIDVVASASNHQISSRTPRVRRSVVFDRTLIGLWRVRRALRDTRYDAVFAPVMNKTTLSGLLANILGGRHAITVAFEHTARRDQYATWFNVQLPVGRNAKTMTEMLVDMARRVLSPAPSDSVAYPTLHLPVTTEQRQQAQTHVVAMQRPLIALNLSSSNPFRMLSEERNAALIDGLCTRIPGTSVLVIGHGDRQAMAERLAARTPGRTRAYPGSADLLDLAAVLETCDLVITPDTSVVHVAAAMSRPVVVMYSLKASFIQEWLPFGVPYRCIMTEGRVDLETIDPAVVVDAAVGLLNDVGGKP